MQDLLSNKNGRTGLHSPHKGRQIERGICPYEKDKSHFRVYVAGSVIIRVRRRVKEAHLMSRLPYSL